LKRRKKFRVGQRVQSVYDAANTFVIDKSRVPERIFHEKGSDRWWTRNELQHLGAPENPSTSIRLNGTGRMRANARKCAPSASGGLQIVAGVVAGLEKRKCLECGTRFQPKRPWQKFHTEACRRANGERVRKSARLTANRGTHCKLSAGTFGLGAAAAIIDSTPA